MNEIAANQSIVLEASRFTRWRFAQQAAPGNGSGRSLPIAANLPLQSWCATGAANALQETFREPPRLPSEGHLPRCEAAPLQALSSRERSLRCRGEFIDRVREEAAYLV